MSNDPYRSVSGEVLYLHDDKGQVGHENFVITKDLNLNRTLRAICEIYQEDLLRDKDILSEDEFYSRYGWSDDKTFKKHYRVKNKNLNNKNRSAALNNLITMKG